MFNRMYETTATKDYEERIRKTAQENFATRVARSNQNRVSNLARLWNTLKRVVFRPQSHPHTSLKNAEAPR